MRTNKTFINIFAFGSGELKIQIHKTTLTCAEKSPTVIGACCAWMAIVITCSTFVNAYVNISVKCYREIHLPDKNFSKFFKKFKFSTAILFRKNERVDDWFRFFILRNMIELIAEHQGTIKGTIKEQFLFANQLLYSHVQ